MKAAAKCDMHYELHYFLNHLRVERTFFVRFIFEIMFSLCLGSNNDEAFVFFILEMFVTFGLDGVCVCLYVWFHAWCVMVVCLSVFVCVSARVVLCGFAFVCVSCVPARVFSFLSCRHG